MSEETAGSHSNEETLITGGKPLSVILHFLQENTNLKPNLHDNGDVEELPDKESKIFPWIKNFTAQCKNVIPDPDISKLEALITDFLRQIEDSVKECYTKPKRASKLKIRISSFLQVFNMIYGELKQPLEHTTYLDKMSDVMALYIDMELKSSINAVETTKKISDRICSSLFIFLDESMEHILDTILKAKFFIKKYSAICSPIMARLLKEKPGPMFESSYVRYLLSFKLWSKLAGKEQYASIRQDAVAKLTPPPDFYEKRKSGMFSNVLPSVPKREKERITLFFMRFNDNVKEKAQVFLKEEKKMLPNLCLDKSPLNDDSDLQVISLIDDDSDVPVELSDQSTVLMNDIWTDLVDREDDCFDSLFTRMDIIDLDEDDENINDDLKKSKPKEKSKKIAKDKLTNNVIKTPLRKRKALKVNNNNSLKNISCQDIMDLIRSHSESKPPNFVTPKEEIPLVPCIKTEDSSSPSLNNPEQKKKPCATIEPEQCKDITDSSSNVTGVLPIKLNLNTPTTSHTVPSLCETVVNVSEELSSAVETSVSPVVTPNKSRESSYAAAPVDSTGIDERPVSDIPSNGVFIETSEASFKIGKPDDATRILEDSFAHEEEVISSEVIGSEMEQDVTFFFLEDDGKLDHNDIINVIGISGNPATFENEVVVHSETHGIDEDKTQIAIGSLFDCQNCSLATNNESKVEQSSESQDNKFLSTINASPETNETIVSLHRRQDSLYQNEMFLDRLFSDPTHVDDGSDDDCRYQHHRMFAGGGKIPAFSEHMEESKSDNEEDMEPLTPSSDSQQQSPLDRSLDISLQVDTVESSPPEPNQEMKNVHNADEGEVATHSKGTSEKKLDEQEHRHMKELSVHLSFGDVASANEHISNKEKLSPKGMFEPPDHILHFKTVEFDNKFKLYQIQLGQFYSTVANILETDPVPYPPFKVTDYPIAGYWRCPCSYCNTSIFKLVEIYEALFQIRSRRILSHVDRNRVLMRNITEHVMLARNGYADKENEQLMKYVAENIAQESSKDLNPEIKTDPLTDSENGCITPINKEIVSKDGDSGGMCEKNNGEKEFSSLPPKKRKAFNVGLEESDFDKSKRLKVGDESNTSKQICVLPKQMENLPTEDSAFPSKESANSISDTSEGCHRLSPIKIKAVDDSYQVLSETSFVTETSDANENIPKRHCRKKKKKEMRKEMKRLKKLKKKEERSNK